MSKKSQKRNKRFKTKKNKQNFKSNVRQFKRTLLFIFVFGAFGILLQTYFSLRLVVNQFSKTTQWDISSQVFSEGTTLYSGQFYKKQYVEDYLKQLSYSEVQSESDLGHARYLRHKDSKALTVYFHHSKDQIEFVFNQNQFLEKIFNLNSSGIKKELSTYALPSVVLAEFYGDKREKRTVLEFSEFPKELKRAIVSMEDRGFYDHHGVSIKGILRAIVTNLTKKSYAQGGSTLTQQLMKNFFLSHEKTLWRKWKELVLALVVERMYDKQTIFQMYLNEIYLGQVGSVSIHGFEEASQLYFHDSVKNISISQQAMLVGLISSPGRYSPFNNFERSIKRRNLVLARMFNEKIITQKDFNQAELEDIVLAKKRKAFEQNMYLKDSVLKELNKNFSEIELKQKGYKIYTTVDPVFQKSLEQFSQSSYQKVLSRQKLNLNQLQMGAVSIHPGSGAIKAIVTGGGNVSHYNHVYQMRRPIGSIVKPLILAYMVDKYKNDEDLFISNTMQVEDKKLTVEYDDKQWSPKNYANKYYGTVSLRSVIEKSLNSGFLDLIQSYSFEDVYEMANKFGFKKYKPVPSIALGAIESNPYEVAGLYAMFANSGVSVSPSLIKSVKDKSESKQSRQLKTQSLISEQSAYQVLSLMKGVLSEGTGKSSKSFNLEYEYAGKTGTSNDHKDAWFVGVSKNLITVVWFGLEDAFETNLSGSNSSLQVWLNYTKKIESYLNIDKIDIPSGVKFKKIDKNRACRWGFFKRRKNTFNEVFLDQYEIERCSSEKH